MLTNCRATSLGKQQLLFFHAIVLSVTTTHISHCARRFARDTQFKADGTLQRDATQQAVQPQAAGSQCRGVSLLLQATTAATYDLKRNDAIIANYMQIAGASDVLIMVFIVPEDHYKSFKIAKSEEQKGLRTYKCKCDGF
jgi:CMP-N-acetylneuraminic acid synthetase